MLIQSGALWHYKQAQQLTACKQSCELQTELANKLQATSLGVQAMIACHRQQWHETMLTATAVGPCDLQLDVVCTSALQHIAYHRAWHVIAGF